MRPGLKTAWVVSVLLLWASCLLLVIRHHSLVALIVALMALALAKAWVVVAKELK